MSPALAGRFSTTEPPRKAMMYGRKLPFYLFILEKVSASVLDLETKKQINKEKKKLFWRDTKDLRKLHNNFFFFF